MDAGRLRSRAGGPGPLERGRAPGRDPGRLHRRRTSRPAAFVKGLCAEAGLAVREDAVGNTFARWEGLRPDLPAVATGSHIDAIPGAGRFDGTVGVLGGIEAIRALKRAGYRPTRPIELILFTSEEPTRFGVGCLGSRAMSGALGPEALAALRDGEGRTLDEVRRAAGFAGPLDSVRLPAGHYAGVRRAAHRAGAAPGAGGAADRRGLGDRGAGDAPGRRSTARGGTPGRS